VDDVSWVQVEEANKEFVQQNAGFQSLLKMKLNNIQADDWWNGFEVIGRGII